MQLWRSSTTNRKRHGRVRASQKSRCSTLFQFVQRSDYFLAVLVRIHRRIRTNDLSSGINYERVARRKFDGSHIVERTVGSGHLMFSVRQQFEVQTFLCAELFVRVDAVNADTQDNRIPLAELRLVFLKIVRLDCAAGRHVLWIKVENHPLALVVCQTDRVAILRGQCEFRGHCAHFRHRSGKCGERDHGRNDGES